MQVSFSYSMPHLATTEGSGGYGFHMHFDNYVVEGKPQNHLKLPRSKLVTALNGSLFWIDSVLFSSIAYLLSAERYKSPN